MGNTYPDCQKDDENEGAVICNAKKSYKSDDFSALHISDFKERTLARTGKTERTVFLKFIQSDLSENWIREFFVKQAPNLGITIPKQLVSFEEKYLERCMELIHINALQGTRCAVSVNLSPLDLGFESDHTMFVKRDPFDLPKFTIDYPMAVGSEDSVLSSKDDEIVGSIMGSNSMINILSSPLFHRLSGKKLFENKTSIPSDYQGAPDRLTMSPSRKLEKDTSPTSNQAYRCDSVQTAQKSPISESRAGFLADISSASSSSQGMLQCTWDKGIPRFAFSLDDQKELYVANARKGEVIDEKALDYIYSFHFKANKAGTDSDLIGKMKVSSSFSLCSDNSPVLEIEFVLVGTIENHASENHTLSRNSWRSRKLSKIMEIFKAGPSPKHPNPSVFSGSNATTEDLSEYQQCSSNFLETDFIPNLELAAIVVKDHFQHEDLQQDEVGGWGLKYLKKARVKPTVDSLDVSECCWRNAGNCLTSMDIIVPAGPHGGPRTRNGGPSSIIERWRSSGRCDCGGWDLGCPIKVLVARPRSEDGWSNFDSLGHYKSFDMLTEGSEQGTTMLKMVNIRDGMYFISFKSSLLSALQCFAIAVATIHSKSPRLQPKHA